MNRIVLVGAAAVAALSLAACNKNQASNQTPATSDTNAVSNTSSVGQSGPANAAQDATGAAVGSLSASTMGSHDTGAFVSNAAQSDMYEIQAGKIAEQKSKNADVKAFAKMMEKDHTKLSGEMK